MKKSLLFLLIIASFVPNKARAQYLPPSPDASSLVNAGSLYTGNVPEVFNLITLKSRQLSVPVTLSNIGGGIKVEEVASYVGLGWSLSAGGLITRSVKGRPDDDTSGYLTVGKNIPRPPQTDSTLFAAWDNFLKDGEADEFSYNFNGRSGEFFFDVNKKCYFTPDQKLLLNITYGGLGGKQIIKFVITDEMGTVYTFDILEKCSTYEQSWADSWSDINHNLSDYNSSWFLSKIKSADAKDSIMFRYHASNYSMHIRANESNLAYAYEQSMEGHFAIDSTFLTQVYKSWNLDSITCSQAKVEFNYQNDRHDLHGIDSYHPKSLSSINLKYKNVNGDYTERQFQFAYNYVCKGSVYTEASAGWDTVCNRLILSSLTEKNGSLSNNPYYFYYYSPEQLPNRLYSNAQDHWGYYNGATSNIEMIPPTAFTYPNGHSGSCGTANRNPDVLSAECGSLKQITYPDRATKYFSYELNSYNIRTSKISGAGIRVKRIQTNDANGQTMNTYYKYDNLVNSLLSAGYVVTPVQYLTGMKKVSATYFIVISSQSGYPMTTTHGKIIGYDNVTVNDSLSGSILYKYYSPHDCPDYYEMFMVSDWDRQDTINIGGYIANVMTDEDWKRGALKVMLKYDINKNPVSQTVYHYSDIDSFPDSRNYNTLCYPQNGWYPHQLSMHYQKSSGYRRTLSGVDEILYDQASAGTYIIKSTSYYQDNPNQFYTTRVVTTNGKGGYITTKTKYAADYTNSATDGGGNNTISNLMAKHINNLPIEQQVWEQETSASSYQLISGSISGYCKDSAGFNPYKIYKLETATAMTPAQFNNESNLYTGPYARIIPISTSYKWKTTFTHYDVYNNLTEMQPVDGNTQAIIWGYNNTYPVAKIENARVSQSYFSGFEYIGAAGITNTDPARYTTAQKHTGKKSYYMYSSEGFNVVNLPANTTYKLEFWVYGTIPVNVSGPAGSTITALPDNSPMNGWKLKEYTVKITTTGSLAITMGSGGGINYIDDLRLYPKSASMVSYTYDDGGRVSSVTDINNLSVNYTYDGFGRLINIIDENGNLIEKDNYVQP